MYQIKRILVQILVATSAGLAISVIIAQIVPMFLYTAVFGSLATFLIGTMLVKRISSKHNKGQHQGTWGYSFLIALSSSLLVFSFLGTVPINLDRSFSVWILNSVDQTTKHGQNSVEVMALKKATSQYFNPESLEVSRRLEEQVALGNLLLDDQNNVSLTPKGRIFIQISRVIAKIFSLNPRYTGY